MKAMHPLTNKWYFFVDKCLPFGSSISCAIFQAISDAISLVTFRTRKPNVNYLDDYLFAAVLKRFCDLQIQRFLDVCQEINFPVALEKNLLGCLCPHISGTVVGYSEASGMHTYGQVDKGFKLGKLLPQ